MASSKDEIKCSLESPISVPTHGDGGSFSVKVSAHIKAPPSAVFAIVRDTTTWPEWNCFCPKATISKSSPSQSTILEVGTVAVMVVYMTGKHSDPSRDQEIEVTVIDETVNGGKGKGFRVSWKANGFAKWQLRSERVIEFRETENGETEYVSWETTGGALGKIALSSAGKQLVERFTEQVRSLKEFAENRKA